MLLVDGKPIRAAKDGTFTVLGEDAAPVTLRLLNRGLDLIPDVKVGDRTVVLMKPLHWFDYAWCLLPVAMFLVAIPGPVSGILGALVTYFNLRLFRTIRSPFGHDVAAALVSIVALALYFWGSLFALNVIAAPATPQTVR
jgi:hypothetical protein